MEDGKARSTMNIKRPPKDEEWFKKPCRIPRDEAIAQVLATTTITATEAYKRFYPKSAKWKPKNLHSKASLKKAMLLPRIQYLQEQQSSANCISAIKRKEILSRIALEIGGQDPADYVEAGPDGVYIKFGPESRNRLAIASLKSRTEVSGEGGDGGPSVKGKKAGTSEAVITELRLRPTTEAIQAIDILNKMEGSYAAEKVEHGITEELAELLKGFDQEGFGAPHLIGKKKDST